MSENKTGKYFKYAIGEIVLVVIGILIALQINNANEARKIREKERTYLQNIKNDLKMNILELDRFITTRAEQIKTASRIITYFNGEPVKDWNAFNKDIVSIYIWQRFFQTDNTFQELVNSGNLAIISNGAIKDGLLNLDVLYKKLKYNEDHFRYDSEVTLYEPSYSMVDIDPMAKNFFYQVTDGKMGDLGNLGEETFGGMLKDLKQKNGFAFAILEFSTMIDKFNQMKTECENIISLIEKDLQND